MVGYLGQPRKIQILLIEKMVLAGDQAKPVGVTNTSDVQFRTLVSQSTLSIASLNEHDGMCTDKKLIIKVFCVWIP